MHVARIGLSFLFSVPTFLLVILARQCVESLEIVNMGDSFTSGFGARDVDGNTNYEGPDGCSRSPTSWAAQYAANIGASFTNVACGGGVVRELTSSPRKLNSVHKWFWQSCPEPSSDDEYLEASSIFSCDRYVKPQIDAVTSLTDLVMITIGVNNIGGVGFLIDCFVPPFGSGPKCQEALDNAQNEMAGIETQLIDMLLALERRLGPQAKVVIFHYPLFVQDVGYTIGTVSPDADEQTRDIFTHLNEVISNAATTGNNSNFVEVYTLTPSDFAGHEVDPRLGFAHVNEDRWMYEPIDGLDLWHVNPRGHEGFALAIQAQRGTFGL